MAEVRAKLHSSLTDPIINASDDFFNPVSCKRLQKYHLSWVGGSIIKFIPNPTDSTDFKKKLDLIPSFCKKWIKVSG